MSRVWTAIDGDRSESRDSTQVMILSHGVVMRTMLQGHKDTNRAALAVSTVFIPGKFKLEKVDMDGRWESDPLYRLVEDLPPPPAEEPEEPPEK